MSKEEIISYVMETPGNTNPNVLRSLLDSDGGGLPPVTSADNGKVLTVQDGAWAAGGVLVETTYSDLKALRDAGNLVPGTAYRITDYVTIINGKYDLSAIGASGYLHYAVSAGHPFDIIVMAVGESELSEVARAAHHDGDTYFANAAVDAWEVKYCLDNDTSRFMWADATNGKGVIFGLKDEFNNECGYDFKNLMFPRYALKLADATADYTPQDTGLVYDSSSQPNRYGSLMQIFDALLSYMATGTYVNPWKQHDHTVDTVNNYDFAVGANILGVTQFAELNDTYKSAFECDCYYTFDYFDATHMDASLNAGGIMRCYGNKISETPDGLYVRIGAANVPAGLNGTVFESANNGNGQPYSNDNIISSGAILNTFGRGSSCNVLGVASFGNTFGNAQSNNTFENYCDSNILGDYCEKNEFGAACSHNVLSSQCYANKFGSSCDWNVLFDNCSENTFKSYCSSNVFGGMCSYNTLGNHCTNNLFGDSNDRNCCANQCQSNEFGYSCSSNTFWNSCSANILADYCGSNVLGDACTDNHLGHHVSYISIGGSSVQNKLYAYISYSSIGKAVSCIELQGGSSSGNVTYYHICDRVGGSETTPLAISTIAGLTHETWVGYNSSNVLKTWCPADLAQ